LANIRDSSLLAVLQHCADMVKATTRMGINKPVLNIPLDTLQPLMGEILRSVKTIQKEATRLKANVVPHFPNDTFRSDVAPKMGNSRYEGAPGPPLLIGSEFPS